MAVGSGARLRVAVGNPFPFTVADNVGITKGQLLKLITPRTASGTRTADGAPGAAAFAGIASRDKIAGSGISELGCWRSGWFHISASGSIGVGSGVKMVPDDHVALWTSGAHMIGIALEDTSGDGDQILVELIPDIPDMRKN